MEALVATGFLASTAATALPPYAASTGLAAGLAPGAVAAAQIAGSIACATTRICTPLGRLVLIATLLAIGSLGYLRLASGTAGGLLVGTVAA